MCRYRIHPYVNTKIGFRYNTIYENVNVPRLYEIVRYEVLKDTKSQAEKQKWCALRSV